MNKQIERKRIDFLDYLRFFASFAVVLQHAVENIYSDFYHFGETIFNFGLFGVVVFFMISGKVFSVYRWRGAGSFIKNRILRLFPELIVVFALIILAAKLGATEWTQRVDSFDLGGLAANFFLINELIGVPYLNGVTWTLPVEIVFYGVLLVASFHRRGFDLILLAVLALIALTWSLDIRLPLGRISLVLLAMATYQRAKAELPILKRLWTGCIWLLPPLLLIYYLQFPHKNIVPWALFWSWMVAVIFYEIIALVGTRGIPWVRSLADLTYALYLVHPVVMWTVLYPPFPVNTGPSAIAIIIVGSLVAAWLVTFAADLIRKWLKRVTRS